MQSVYDQFNASVRRIERYQVASTPFEKFHTLTLDWRAPIVVSLLYVVVVSYFSKMNRARQSAAVGKSSVSRGKKHEPAASEPRFTPFKCLVIAHNVLLCAYSAFTFLSVLPIIFKPYFHTTALKAFCDVDKSIFRSGVNFWVWNFYVSKYYELLDTVILLAKGKPSSFLQTFHHSGSIIGMWIMTVTHAPAAWIFVLFNSFIHTVMYFYYTLTCFGRRPAWKKLLTTMQIVQFVVGNPLGVLYAFLPGCFPSEIIPPENIIAKILGSQSRSLYVCLCVNTVFISSLVVLFTDFSRKTYGSRDDKNGKNGKDGKDGKTVSNRASTKSAVTGTKKTSSKKDSKETATREVSREPRAKAIKTTKTAKKTTPATNSSPALSSASVASKAKSAKAAGSSSKSSRSRSRPARLSKKLD